MEKSQGIKARVKLEHVKGAELAYIYEKKELYNLGFKPSEYDKFETYLNVGDLIKIAEVEHKIIKIHTKVLEELIGSEDFGGSNMYGLGEQQSFNFQITYVLDDNFKI